RIGTVERHRTIEFLELGLLAGSLGELGLGDLGPAAQLANLVDRLDRLLRGARRPGVGVLHAAREFLDVLLAPLPEQQRTGDGKHQRQYREPERTAPGRLRG